ncbi:MAG: flagellar basal body L-ring protein FlgH [Candidatus Cloacimonetes bacterium]|nr:flagellar basal body L-ring protein FlgH [Candidatus Cloacimonadota bacterium]MCA9785337.1 flagellar basal body L-ring protein FlgH [Candidatus Cloacimonadota bacterium]
MNAHRMIRDTLAALLLSLLCSTVAVSASRAPFLAGSLFADDRSLEVGQVLTVVIVESGSGSNSASINTKREDGLSIGASGAGGPLTFMPSISGTSAGSNEHKSKGTNARSSSLNGTITVEIVSIEPNGLLVIEGQRVVELDGEEQITEISGRVRPADVAADNTVYSYLVADAVIRYSGRGLVRDSQRRGLIGWLFGWMI